MDVVGASPFEIELDVEVAYIAVPTVAVHLYWLSMDTPFVFDVDSALEFDSVNFAAAAIVKWKQERTNDQ